jgi:hypothetical protein
MTTATEPVNEAPAAPIEAAPAEGAPETPAAPPAGSPAARAFDPEALPAEIKGYVTKQREAAAAEAATKYADYERRVAEAKEWEGVRNDPRFQKWAESLRTPEPPKAFEITDDQFAAALSDKGQFAKLVQDAAKALMEQTVGPQLESVKQHNEFQSKVTELQQTVAKFPDFKELDKRGLIEPIIRKYPGMTFEDAYKLAKHETINEEADRRARGIVAAKKAAIVERPGIVNAGKGAPVKAKNREEAMNMVAEAIRAGRPVPEFDEIGDS